MLNLKMILGSDYEMTYLVLAMKFFSEFDKKII